MKSAPAALNSSPVATTSHQAPDQAIHSTSSSSQATSSQGQNQFRSLNVPAKRRAKSLKRNKRQRLGIFIIFYQGVWLIIVPLGFAWSKLSFFSCKFVLWQIHTYQKIGPNLSCLANRGLLIKVLSNEFNELFKIDNFRFYQPITGNLPVF